MVSTKCDDIGVVCISDVLKKEYYIIMILSQVDLRDWGIGYQRGCMFEIE
jgi:hypothetical protein